MVVNLVHESKFSIFVVMTLQEEILFSEPVVSCKVIKAVLERVWCLVCRPLFKTR